MARLGGSPSRARQAYLAARSRFGGTAAASAAAFELGRIAFDLRGAPGEAARWFETHLRERPSGTFGREAAGRLVEARQRSGDSAGARDAARDYLRRYPNGPHADIARAIAER